MEDFWSSFSSFVHNMVPVSLSLQYFVSVAYAKMSIVVGLLCLVMSLPSVLDHVVGYVNFNFFPVIHSSTETLSWYGTVASI